MKTAILLIAALALAACGSTVSRKWSDPEFDSADLSEGRLLVGAVVAVPELHRQGHTAERAYTERLDRVVREHRDDLPLEPASTFVDHLSLEQIDAVLERYRLRGSLDPNALTPLQNLADSSRYLLLCRLEANEIDQTASTGTAMDDDESIAYTSSYSIKRTVTASFDIFDVVDGRLVWTAQLFKQDQRRRDRESGRRYMDTPEEVKPSFSYTGDGGYPEAPEFLDLLGSLFDDLAKELPKG